MEKAVYSYTPIKKIDLKEIGNAIVILNEVINSNFFFTIPIFNSDNMNLSIYIYLVC